MPRPENVTNNKPKKGEVRNPKGKPKGTLNRATLFRRVLEFTQAVKHPITGEMVEMSQAEIMLWAQARKARKEDTRAVEFLFTGLFGKMPDRVEMGNPGSFDLRDLSDEELEELIRKNR